MDSLFITAALSSTFNVFETMAKFRPKPGIPLLKAEPLNYGDVTAVMQMRGYKATGKLAISFPENVIIDIAQRMLNEHHTEIDADICDLTGELANMIVGGAKKILSEKGYDFDMSTPAVFTNHSGTTKNSFTGETVSLPFETNKGTFYLELTYAEPLVEKNESKQVSMA